MLPTHNGAFRLFRLAGVTVFLHWSWLLIAFYQIQYRRAAYGSLGWAAADYIALFAIVIMHEFGHALACRSVGGAAEQIVLWPLGGIAYVNPPPRPGALLWSIAAGPLVNVVLLPILWGLYFAGGPLGLAGSALDFAWRLAFMNTALLAFNLLPIFPLDGGQIVRALLWYPLGRGRSLTVASIIGIIGVVAGLGAALMLWGMDWWLLIIGAFVIMQCVQGFKQARILSRIDGAPRHERVSCPSCGAAPICGAWWHCGKCGERFDMFDTEGRCPSCDSEYQTAACPECRQTHPLGDWLTARD